MNSPSTSGQKKPNTTKLFIPSPDQENWDFLMHLLWMPNNLHLFAPTSLDSLLHQGSIDGSSGISELPYTCLYNHNQT
jgi:hypothetical protein